MTELEPTPVAVRSGRVMLPGDLTIPDNPAGVVVFAHGSGSSRKSPRNRAVAAELADEGFATLLFDLLTREEEIIEQFSRHLRFNIPLLSERLIGVLEWVGQSQLDHLPIGLFGASTGAAAALVAASRMPVHAVVSRGGRPDLAGEALPRVRCPTLLIVGSADTGVIELNRRAAATLGGPTVLHLVEGAGHLFEEPGTLREVIMVASSWFRTHLDVLRSPFDPLWDH
jgi:putative phosphoribosyl transferase